MARRKSERPPSAVRLRATRRDFRVSASPILPELGYRARIALFNSPSQTCCPWCTRRLPQSAGQALRRAVPQLKVSVMNSRPATPPSVTHILRGRSFEGVRP